MIKVVFSLFAAILVRAEAFAQTAGPAPESSAKPPALSAESFAAPPFLDEPALSPSGQFIAARFLAQGKPLLVMASLFDKAAKPVSMGLESERVSVDWWRWVNDDWLLIGISATTSFEGSDIRINRVMSISRVTKAVNRLAWNSVAQNGGRVIHVFRDGSPRIQRSIYYGPEFWTEVVEMDVSTGKSRSVVKPREGVMSYYADGHGNVRMGFGYNDGARTAWLLYRPDGRGAFRTVDRANLRRDEVLNMPDTFLAEPGKATTITQDDDGFGALYEFDLTTMQRGKKIFGVKGYDIDGVIETPSGDGVAAIMLTEDRPRVHWLDPGLAQTQAEIDKAVGAGRAARIVSWSQDRNILLVKVGGADQAGAYYVYNRAAGGSMHRFAYVDANLKMTRLSPVSTIAYKARDGVEIKGVLTQSTAGQEPSAHPASARRAGGARRARL